MWLTCSHEELKCKLCEEDEWRWLNAARRWRAPVWVHLYNQLGTCPWTWKNSTALYGGLPSDLVTQADVMGPLSSLVPNLRYGNVFLCTCNCLSYLFQEKKKPSHSRHFEQIFDISQWGKKNHQPNMSPHSFTAGFQAKLKRAMRTWELSFFLPLSKSHSTAKLAIK